MASFAHGREGEGERPGKKAERHAASVAGVKLRPTELGATELALATLPAELEELAAAVRADGGAVLATYREPLGGHALMLTALPVDKVVPTPFQRDISDAHVRRLTQAMDKTKRFLDPIIAVREQTGDAAYWTPNGYHRLTALKELGAKTVLALLVPERPVAYQILALNIEKAHNLREKAIGVRRMYVDLAPVSDGDEESYALEFEEPALATLGFAYEERGRLSGGAYHSILRKADRWLSGKLAAAEPKRRARAALLLDVRRGRDGAGGGAQGARVQQPVPAQLRRGAHQPAALHQGRAAADRGAAAVDDQADAGHGRRQDQERGRRAHGRRRARGRRGLTGRQR